MGLLIEYKADVNQKNKKGHTALDHKLWRNHFVCVEILRNQGAKTTITKQHVGGYLESSKNLHTS